MTSRRSLIRRLALLGLLALPALAGCRGDDRGGGNLIAADADAGTLWRGDHSQAAERAYVVARDGVAWSDLWSRVGQPAPTPLPTGRMAVAVFLGPRDSGGYGVVIDRAQTSGGDLLVGYRETVPGPDAPVAAVLTSPYVVRLIPAAAGTPKFIRDR